MKILTIELDRGHDWEFRALGQIPADTSLEALEADLRAYAPQHPHRALVDGLLVARVSPRGSGDPVLDRRGV